VNLFTSENPFLLLETGVIQYSKHSCRDKGLGRLLALADMPLYKPVEPEGLAGGDLIIKVGG